MRLVRSVEVKGVFWLQTKYPTHPSYPHKTVVARLLDMMLVHLVGLISTMGVNGVGVGMFVYRASSTPFRVTYHGPDLPRGAFVGPEYYHCLSHSIIYPAYVELNWVCDI